MKNKIALILLITLTQLAHAVELNVVANTVDLNLSKDAIVARNYSESVEQVQAYNVINVRVDEHVVIRTELSKLSFSPLSANNKSFKAVIGVNIPDIYSSVMTLFQEVYQQPEATKKECRVLVFDGLLTESHRARLTTFLNARNVEVEQHELYSSFDCLYKSQEQ